MLYFTPLLVKSNDVFYKQVPKSNFRDIFEYFWSFLSKDSKKNLPLSLKIPHGPLAICWISEKISPPIPSKRPLRQDEQKRMKRQKRYSTKFYLVEKVPHISPKSGNRIGTEVDRIKKFLQNGVGNHIDKNRVLLGRGINFQLSGHVFLNPSGR